MGWAFTRCSNLPRFKLCWAALHNEEKALSLARESERGREKRHGIVVDITKWYAFVTGQHKDDFSPPTFLQGKAHEKRQTLRRPRRVCYFSRSVDGTEPQSRRLSALIIHSRHIPRVISRMRPKQKLEIELWILLLFSVEEDFPFFASIQIIRPGGR